MRVFHARLGLLLALLTVGGFLLLPAASVGASSPAPGQPSASPISAFGSGVTFQNESSHYCTSDATEFPDCISTQTPQGVPVDAYEFKLTLRNPAIDGSAAAGFSATTGSISLSTSYPNDLILVYVSISGNPTVTVTDSSSLKWTLRALETTGVSGEVASFYAISTSPLSSDKITVQASQTEPFTIVTFGVSGADTAAPFDPSLPVPAASFGSSGNPSLSLTTTYASDLVVGSIFVDSNPSVTAGSGLSILKTTTSGTATEGSVEAALISSSGPHTVAFSLKTTTAPWALIADAIVGGGSTGGTPYLWYLHFPTCNCTVAPNSAPINTIENYYSNGTMILRDILASNETTILTLNFNSNTGVQKLTLNNLQAVQHAAGVLMAFLYNTEVTNGETLTFTPDGSCDTSSCYSDFVASPNGVYLTDNYDFAYTVFGSVYITGPSGNVLATAAPGTVQHRWGDLNQYQGYEQLEDSWEITGAPASSTQQSFAIDLGDILDNYGVRSQLGGILWLGTSSQQPLGLGNGMAPYTIAQPSGSKGCTKFVLTIPTSQGSLTGTVTFHADFGGDCDFEHGWFTGTLSLGTTSYVVTGVAAEFYCATSTLPGCGNTPISTTTGVVCTPTSVPVNEQTTCTATSISADTVLPPTGTVSFTQSPTTAGSFGEPSCNLTVVSGNKSESQCSTTFAPSPGSEGTISVTVSYSGDVNHAPSSGSTTVDSIVRSSSTTTTCTPSTFPEYSETDCTATVTDISAGTPEVPLGTVTFGVSPSSGGSFGSPDCSLVAGSCSVYFDATSTGSASITATYSGDTDHGPSSSSAEISVIQLRPTSTLVSCSPSSLPTDSSSTCTVTVSDTGSGTPTTPTGTISFALSPVSDGSFAPTTCVLDGGTCSVTLSASVSSGSATVSASYPGDTYHSPSLGTYTVTFTQGNGIQATPTVTASPTPSSVIVGSYVFDAAMLSGATSNAGGMLTFYYSPSSACPSSSAVRAGPQVAVSGDGPFDSSSIQMSSVGTLYWYAVYSGDANNAGAFSTCKPLVVSQTTPTLSTLLSSNSITAGGSVSASATLSGSFGADGTVTYLLYSGGSCQGNPSVVSTVEVSDSVIPSSGPVSFPSAGAYSWDAQYSGDTNNKPAVSPCESLAVNQATPAISLAVSPSSIPAGGSVTGSTTILGSAPDAGGSVTYEYYKGGSCAGVPVVIATVPVTNGVVPSTGPVVFNNAGTYQLAARYSGDANDLGAASSCFSLTVNRATPSINTTLSATSIFAGQAAFDSAILTGESPTASGTVTYQFYGNDTCSGTPTVVGTPVQVTNGLVPNSASQSLGTTGSYGWVAVYSGDANNAGATGPCEQLTVKPADPTSTVVAVNPSPVFMYETATVTATVKDTATSGATAPQGTIAWSVNGGGTLSSSGCTLSPLSGKAQSDCSVTFTAPAGPVGDKISATYSPGSDLSHAPSSGTFTLKVTNTIAVVTPHTSSETVGSPTSITYVVQITDERSTPASPTGTVAWSDGGKAGIFSAATCTLEASNSSTASCQVTYTPNAGASAGTMTITAKYPGSTTQGLSSGTAQIVMSKSTKSVSTSMTPGFVSKFPRVLQLKTLPIVRNSMQLEKGAWLRYGTEGLSLRATQWFVAYRYRNLAGL